MDEPKIARALTGIARDRAELEQQRRAAAPRTAPLSYDTVLALRAVYSDAIPRERAHFAIIALAVAAASRISELLGSHVYPERALRARQVRFFADQAGLRPVPVTRAASALPAPDHLTVELLVSKTDQFREGAEKIVSARSAVEAMWSLCCATETHGDPPLFVNANGTPITANAVVSEVRKRLTRIGRADLARTFTSHGLRKGGASTVSAMGYSDADIARLGWAEHSTVGRTIYARDPRVQRARAHAINAQMERPSQAGGSGF